MDNVEGSRQRQKMSRTKPTDLGKVDLNAMLVDSLGTSLENVQQKAKGKDTRTPALDQLKETRKEVAKRMEQQRAKAKEEAKDR